MCAWTWRHTVDFGERRRAVDRHVMGGCWMVCMDCSMKMVKLVVVLAVVLFGVFENASGKCLKFFSFFLLTFSDDYVVCRTIILSFIAFYELRNPKWLLSFSFKFAFIVLIFEWVWKTSLFVSQKFKDCFWTHLWESCSLHWQSHKAVHGCRIPWSSRSFRFEFYWSVILTFPRS